MLINTNISLKYLEIILKWSMSFILIEKSGALNPVTLLFEHFSSSLRANKIFLSNSSKFSFLTESWW